MIEKILMEKEILTIEMVTKRISDQNKLITEIDKTVVNLREKEVTSVATKDLSNNIHHIQVAMSQLVRQKHY